MKLSIEGLSKTYVNGVKALEDVSLEISKGMYGLLGPNGAGKSTLMRTLATLQEADQGTIMLDDLNVLTDKHEVRKILGYLPQQFGLYPKISAEVLLHHFAVLKGITNKRQRREVVSALLHKTNLYEVRKQRLGSFSGGMKQRFGIAQALLNSPQLLIVDEPTAGLDPKERNRFYNLLSEVSEQAIVLLSTHIVEDIKELCNHMAIINNGKVILKGNPIELLEELKGKVYQKTIHRSEINLYKEHYQVINDKMYLGQPVIQVVSETPPGNGFTSIEASIEELYFAQINN